MTAGQRGPLGWLVVFYAAAVLCVMGTLSMFGFFYLAAFSHPNTARSLEYGRAALVSMFAAIVFGTAWGIATPFVAGRRP